MLPPGMDFAGLDVLITKNNRALAGMCIQEGDDLYIQSGTVFREIPVDYTIKPFGSFEFTDYARAGGFKLSSFPKVGDTVIWYTGGMYFPLARRVIEVVKSRGGDYLLVDREGVRQIVHVRTSAVFTT